MVIVNVEVKVEAGAIDSIKDAVAAMETESRKEPGCQVYAFSVDVNDPTTVRITEHWDSLADLQNHFTLPHMAAFGAALGTINILSMDAKAYETAAEVPLPI